MIPVFVMLVGGTGFGLGIGVIIGYRLGRCARAGEQRAGPRHPHSGRRSPAGVW